MININKVTTKTGDRGKTLGPGCQMMEKGSNLVELIGKLDELNVNIGNSIEHLKCSIFKIFSKNRKHKLFLQKTQDDLFDIGALFYKKDYQTAIIHIYDLIKELENKILNLNNKLPALDSFLLPTGSKLIIALHEARCRTRSAERMFWKVFNENLIDKNLESIGIYLNRLSDFIFVLIREKSKKKWIPFEKKLSNKKSN